MSYAELKPHIIGVFQEQGIDLLNGFEIVKAKRAGAVEAIVKRGHLSGIEEVSLFGEFGECCENASTIFPDCHISIVPVESQFNVWLYLNDHKTFYGCGAVVPSDLLGFALTDAILQAVIYVMEQTD